MAPRTQRIISDMSMVGSIQIVIFWLTIIVASNYCYDVGLKLCSASQAFFSSAGRPLAWPAPWEVVLREVWLRAMLELTPIVVHGLALGGKPDASLGLCKAARPACSRRHQLRE